MKTVQSLDKLLINAKKPSFEDRINFVFFAIYLVIALFCSTNLSFSFWPTFAKGAQLFCLAVISIVICFELVNRKIKWNPICFILALVGLVNAFVTGHTLILSFSIFFFGFANYDFKNLLKRYLLILGITFLLIEVFVLIGLIPMGYSYRDDSTRLNLGFQTATLAPSIFFFFSLGVLYLYKEKTSYLFLLFSFLFSFALFKLTDTRTGFYLTLIALAIGLLFKFKWFKSMTSALMGSKIFKFLCLIFPLFVLVFDLSIVNYYSTFSPLAFRLNSLFSTRLSLSLNLIQNEGFSLFGKKIPTFVDGQYYQSDICYIYYGLNYGVLSLLLTIYLQTKAIAHGFKHKDIWIVICLALVIVDGIFEPYILDYKYQIFTFILCNEMLSEKKNVVLYVYRNELAEERV